MIDIGGKIPLLENLHIVDSTIYYLPRLVNVVKERPHKYLQGAHLNVMPCPSIGPK